MQQSVHQAGIVETLVWFDHHFQCSANDYVIPYATNTDKSRCFQI